MPLLIKFGWLNRYSPSGFSFSSRTRPRGPAKLNSGIKVCANTQGVLPPRSATLRDQNRCCSARGPKHPRVSASGSSCQFSSRTSTRKSPELFSISSLVSELGSNSQRLHASSGRDCPSPALCQSRFESAISGTGRDGLEEERLASAFDCKGFNYREWQERIPRTADCSTGQLLRCAT